MADPILSLKITDLTLENVKDYLKIDFTEDDVLLITILTASMSFIQNYLKQKFVDMEEIPDELTIAALAIMSHWYENRQILSEKQTGKEIPFVFSGILDMHRNWLD